MYLMYIFLNMYKLKPYKHLRYTDCKMNLKMLCLHTTTACVLV